jgi:hypothetical protein
MLKAGELRQLSNFSKREHPLQLSEMRPERRQNRLAGSMVCGRKQVCKLACEIVYSRRPKIARDLCLLSSTAIVVETISFISG